MTKGSTTRAGVAATAAMSMRRPCGAAAIAAVSTVSPSAFTISYSTVVPAKSASALMCLVAASSPGAVMSPRNLASPVVGTITPILTVDGRLPPPSSVPLWSSPTEEFGKIEA